MRTCPDCYTELYQSIKNGVEIDYCPKCKGIWLDHGELEKLLKSASQIPMGHAPQTPPPNPYANHYTQPTSGYVPDPHAMAYDYSKQKKMEKMHKKAYKYKHHPVASFIEEIFDIF